MTAKATASEAQQSALAQPKDFGFDDDVMMLRDSARKLLAERCSAPDLHALVADDIAHERTSKSAWDESLWQQIVALGWTAACVPPAHGGVGMPAVAAVALAEEAGRCALPSPLITTINATFVLNQCDSAAAGAALQEIATGAAATLAVTNQAGAWASDATDVEVRDGRLYGVSCFVQDAQKCTRLLVSARHGSAVELYWVALDAPGVTIQPDSIVDLTRDQARVEFAGAQGTLLSTDGAAALQSALPAILSVVSADMVGAGEWLLQTTTEYVSTRTQFDRPLGFFQAVKHPLVDVMIAIDNAKSLAYNAACAFDCEPARAAEYAHMAKAEASDMAVFSANRAVQFHGGIGFTWECYVHLFFKRQMHNQLLFGDAKHHRNKLATMLFDAA